MLFSVDSAAQKKSRNMRCRIFLCTLRASHFMRALCGSKKILQHQLQDFFIHLESLTFHASTLRLKKNPTTDVAGFLYSP
jgi:hypothetical protein